MRVVFGFNFASRVVYGRRKRRGNTITGLRYVVNNKYRRRRRCTRETSLRVCLTLIGARECMIVITTEEEEEEEVRFLCIKIKNV